MPRKTLPDSPPNSLCCKLFMMRGIVIVRSMRRYDGMVQSIGGSSGSDSRYVRDQLLRKAIQRTPTCVNVTHRSLRVAAGLGVELLIPRLVMTPGSARPIRSLKIVQQAEKQGRLPRGAVMREFPQCRIPGQTITDLTRSSRILLGMFAQHGCISSVADSGDDPVEHHAGENTKARP